MKPINRTSLTVKVVFLPEPEPDLFHRESGGGGGGGGRQRHRPGEKGAAEVVQKKRVTDL